MDYTPRLKNLLRLRRSLLALSNAVSNLSDDDCAILENHPLPRIVDLNILSDWIAEIIRKRITVSQQAALPADQVSLFCAVCGDDSPHQRLVANGQSRYKCTRCGTVGGAL